MFLNAEKILPIFALIPVVRNTVNQKESLILTGVNISLGKKKPLTHKVMFWFGRLIILLLTTIRGLGNIVWLWKNILEDSFLPMKMSITRMETKLTIE